jgi:hypothetical protein
MPSIPQAFCSLKEVISFRTSQGLTLSGGLSSAASDGLYFLL